ncbi:MAG: SAM-dependent methyltransferase [Thermoleophilaceae bacterium]
MTERLERDYFEGLYGADRDPWGFETSAYEAEKYERTVAALQGRRFDRGLEVGCSIGVLTAMLAARCDALVAVDVSELAVEQARRRLAELDHVIVERRTLPEEMPSGPFDLIVCSEVLYYWDRELLLTALDALEAALAPGGSLLAVHWRPPTQTYPLRGDEVHELLLERSSLEPAWSAVEERYRIDRLDRPR